MKTTSKIIIGMCVISVILGISTYFIVKEINKNEPKANIEEYAIKEDNTNQINDIKMPDEEIEVSSAEEKVSPNASFTIKKEYKSCGHTIEEKSELPNKIINKTQEEIENQYEDFEVESFSRYEVVLCKQIDGLCNEHYKIKEENGVIVVYGSNEDGEEILYDETGISTQYLPESDMLKIRNGLQIYGKENLNKFIEDFE